MTNRILKLGLKLHSNQTVYVRKDNLLGGPKMRLHVTSEFHIAIVVPICSLTNNIHI